MSTNNYFSVGINQNNSAVASGTTSAGKVITTLSSYDSSYSICPDFNNVAVKDKISDVVREEVAKILLEDPSSEIMELAENYLVGCVEDAMNSPDKNSVIKKYLENIKGDVENIISDKCKSLEAACENIDTAIENYLKKNCYVNYSELNSYIQYEIDANPCSKIRKLQDRIDVLSKIVSDLCVKLDHSPCYDSSECGLYSNGYENYIGPSAGRGI
jgi:hypothetical protein